MHNVARVSGMALAVCLDSVVWPGGAAFAQAPTSGATVPPASEADPTQPRAQPASPTATDQVTNVDDIVVTAQRRAQNVQDVPISVTAVSGDNLVQAGVASAADLGRVVPNLNIKLATGASSPVYTIRGIGTSSYTTNTVPSVGVYVDEVYLTNTSMSAFQLFDIERVEVLRGPQGTLFGRNTTGGAVSYFSKRPTSSFEAEVSGTVGSYKRLDLGGVLSGPLTETLAARVSVQWNNQYEGFFQDLRRGNDYGRAHSIAGRLQLLWQPSSDTEVLLRVYAGNEDSDNWYYLGAGVRQPGAASPDPYLAPQNGGFVLRQRCPAADAGSPRGIRAGCVNALGYRDADGDPFTIEPGLRPFLRNRSLGAALTVSTDLGWADLTSVTGYQNFRYRRSEDFDASPLLINETVYRGNVEQVSQELRLSNTSDRLTWIAGAFYGFDRLRENDEVNQLYSPDYRTIYDVRFRQTTQTYSGFVHLEYNLTPKFRVIAAGRVTHDRITFNGGTVDRLAEAPNAGGLCAEFGLCGGVSAGKLVNSYTEWSGRLGINFKPSDDTLLYASVSRGFKSAAFNGGYQLSAAEVGGIGPEKLIAYEAGFKTDLFERLLRINGAAFLYDYDDIQILGLVLPNLDYRLVNLAKARVWGAEVEATLRPGAGLTISGSAGYVDSEVRRGNTGLAFDVTGNRLPNAPRFTARGTVAKKFAISGALDLTLAADVNWQDKVFYSIENDPLVAERAYALVDLRATLASRSGLELSAWVRNLTDKAYYRESFAAQGSAGLVMYTPGTPRTAGVTLVKRF